MTPLLHPPPPDDALACIRFASSSGLHILYINSHGDQLAWVVDFFGLQEPNSPEAASASPDYVPGPDHGSQEDSKDGGEEEHLAPADSVVAPVVDHVPSSEETEPFETDESAATPPSPPACRTTARISIRPEAPMPFPSEEEVERLLALPPPPPSPLISLSPPSAEERLARCLAAPALPSSPLPIVPHPYGSPNHVRAPPGFRAAMGRLRASSPSTHHPLHPSPPLPPPPSSLHLPPHVPTSLPLPSSPLPPLPASLFIPPLVDRREDTPEAELPPRKRLCLTALTSRYEVGESSTAAPRPAGGHGIDYGFIGTLDAETKRQRAEEYHYETARLLDQEALVSREAWAHSMGFSSAVHYELQGYRTHAWMQDHRIDAQDSLIAALTAQVSSLQGHLATALGEIRALQARDQARADAPEGTASTAVGLVFSFLVSDNHNNMPPRRSSAAASTAAAAPMTAAAVEQLIEARVSTELANHETLQSSTNGHGDGSHNSGIGNRGTTRTPPTVLWRTKLSSLLALFLGNALTWWNSHMKTVTQDVAYANDCKALHKDETVKYCLRRIKKSTLLLKDQAEQKRKLEFTARNNQAPTTKTKCRTLGGLTLLGLVKRGSTQDHCPCVPNATITTKDHVLPGVISARRSAIWLMTVGVLVVPLVHFKRDCPKLKNKNRGNQGRNGNALAKVYVVGNAGKNPDSNVITGTFLLNNRYASILFDTGADNSFVSTTFSSLIDITPTTLDHYYDVELADGKIIGINTIIRGCTLNFLYSSLHNINIMPIELGSFDIIVGWIGWQIAMLSLIMPRRSFLFPGEMKP
ncbi:putative reverse transcriptase domain-containing protein [Tanacetum coccineum]